MPTYFVEYFLSTDHHIRAFFAESEKLSDEEARERIMDGLKKAFGESLLKVDITKQTENKPKEKQKQTQLPNDKEGF